MSVQGLLVVVECVVWGVTEGVIGVITAVTSGSSSNISVKCRATVEATSLSYNQSRASCVWLADRRRNRQTAFQRQNTTVVLSSRCVEQEMPSHGGTAPSSCLVADVFWGWLFIDLLIGQLEVLSCGHSRLTWQPVLILFQPQECRHRLGCLWGVHSLRRVCPALELWRTPCLRKYTGR